MVSKFWFLIISLFLFSAMDVCAEARDKTTAAVVASKEWLAAVDGADYDGSWRQAAAIFKNAVQLAQWRHSMKAVREPLGKVISRRQLSANFHTTLPGAPDGAYVIIKFATVFENKASAVETITPMRGKDGIWRVSGYYIQ